LTFVNLFLFKNLRVVGMLKEITEEIKAPKPIYTLSFCHSSDNN
jgi:hypothetical protein